MTYTDEFLISELHRFIHENGRNPTFRDMNPELGYPTGATYHNRFNSFNNALEAANLEINKTCEKRMGNETCYRCGNILKLKEHWFTNGLLKGQVMCYKCYRNNDYINGNLDVNSSTGFGFLTQRVVAKTLGLNLENDCNCSVSFRHPYDLYDKDKYGKIDVKGRRLSTSNRWRFDLTNNIIDTYIFVGFDTDAKNILRVWIVKPTDKLIHGKTGASIKNNIRSGLTRAKPWEVDSTSYNNTLHSLSIENCSVLTNKKE